MKKLSDIMLEAETLEHTNVMVEDAAPDNSNTIIPPVTPETADRVGAALQKLDQIGEMVDDLYNTISHLEEMDAESDAALTGAYNTVDDLYTKIDEKYDVIPVDFDEYDGDLEEQLELYTDTEIIIEKLSPDAPASEWIDDFVKSDAPQFKGKSKKERIKMALGAYYGAQKNEEVDLDLDEAKMSPQQRADAERVQYGVMKQDDYNKKYKLGKYRPAGNKLAGPGGLYKNLLHKSVREEVDLEESFSPGHDMVPAPIGKDTYQAKGLRKLWGIQMRAGKWADNFVAMYDDGKIGIVTQQGVNRYSTVAAFEKGFEKFRKTGDLDESVELEEESFQLNRMQTFWYEVNKGKYKSNDKKKFLDLLSKYVRAGHVKYVKDKSLERITNMHDMYDLAFDDKSDAAVFVSKTDDSIAFSTTNKFSRRGGGLLPPGGTPILKEAVDVTKWKELAATGLMTTSDASQTLMAIKSIEDGKSLTQAQYKMLANTAATLISVITGDTSTLSSFKRASKK